MEPLNTTLNVETVHLMTGVPKATIRHHIRYGFLSATKSRWGYRITPEAFVTWFERELMDRNHPVYTTSGPGSTRIYISCSRREQFVHHVSLWGRSDAL